MFQYFALTAGSTGTCARNASGESVPANAEGCCTACCDDSCVDETPLPSAAASMNESANFLISGPPCETPCAHYGNSRTRASWQCRNLDFHIWNNFGVRGEARVSKCRSRLQFILRGRQRRDRRVYPEAAMESGPKGHDMIIRRREAPYLSRRLSRVFSSCSRP